MILLRVDIRMLPIQSTQPTIKNGQDQVSVQEIRMVS